MKRGKVRLFSMSPGAILFDFDGVILDTEWSIYESMLEVFRENGHELPLEEYVKCIGSDFNTWSPEKMLEELTGKSFDWDEIWVRRNQWIRSEIEKLDAMPGVRETLERCQERSIPCGVVSSSTQDWVVGWLQKLGLDGCFDEIVTRGDAARIKPAPDLYLEGVKRMKLPPADCLVIEDSMNGMLSAHAAGCPVVAIPNRITSCLDFSKAEFHFSSMSQFFEQL